MYFGRTNGWVYISMELVHIYFANFEIDLFAEPTPSDVSTKPEGVSKLAESALCAIISGYESLIRVYKSYIKYRKVPIWRIRHADISRCSDDLLSSCWKSSACNLRVISIEKRWMSFVETFYFVFSLYQSQIWPCRQTRQTAPDIMIRFQHFSKRSKDRHTTCPP